MALDRNNFKIVPFGRSSYKPGDRHGYLEIIARIDKPKKKERKVYFLAKCDCGNFTILRGDMNTESCGCLLHEGRGGKANRIDLKGKRFGNWTVLEKGPNFKKETTWKCKCDCGTIRDVLTNSLRRDKSKSCGCIQSFGEKAIVELLIKNNIDFKREYFFEDLKGERQILKFDFAIFKDGKISHLIEYDGKQHYDENSKFYSEELINNDRKKDEYCKRKNIKLIRLREYNNLTIEDLI